MHSLLAVRISGETRFPVRPQALAALARRLRSMDYGKTAGASRARKLPVARLTNGIMHLVPVIVIGRSR